MKKNKNLSYLFLFLMLNIDLIYNSNNTKNQKNPFSILGIPTLKPNSKIFNFPDNLPEKNDSNPLDKIQFANKIHEIKSTEELINYLKKGKFKENKGLNIVSKFLIYNEYNSNSNNLVFDISGFDGLSKYEIIYPRNSKERILQKAKSAAMIHVNKTYKA